MKSESIKPDILKQKIGSLLSRVESQEFLEELRIALREQLEKEKMVGLHQESLKGMNKRRGTTSKKQ
jgi:hypothetical protein